MNTLFAQAATAATASPAVPRQSIQPTAQQVAAADTFERAAPACRMRRKPATAAKQARFGPPFWEQVDRFAWLVVVTSPASAVVLPAALMMAGCAAWAPALCVGAMLLACALGCGVLQLSDHLRQRRQRGITAALQQARLGPFLLSPTSSHLAAALQRFG